LENPVMIHQFIQNKMPTVSICIPCIPSHIQYLKDSLSTIINQSYLPEEVVIILSDATPQAEREFIKQIEPFNTTLKIVYQFFPQKQYAGTNRNAAVHLA